MISWFLKDFFQSATCNRYIEARAVLRAVRACDEAAAAVDIGAGGDDDEGEEPGKDAAWEDDDAW